MPKIFSNILYPQLGQHICTWKKSETNALEMTKKLL